jgi:hypothetical protein
MIRGDAIVNHFAQLSDLAHEEPAVQFAVARLLQREPQMEYTSAFEQACPARAWEKGMRPGASLHHLFPDPTEPPAEPLSPEDTSSAAPDADEVCEQDEEHKEGNEETTADPSPASQGPSAWQDQSTLPDYVDPLQQRINEAKKFRKEFYDLSKMVTARGALTLDHVLHLIHNYCERFVGERRIQRKHNTITITFHPFPTPEECKDTLPEGCPGWRLYCPQEKVCIQCPHQKPCFSAQVVPKEQRITQMPYFEYNREKMKRKQWQATFNRALRSKTKKRIREMKKAKAEATATSEGRDDTQA